MKFFKLSTLALAVSLSFGTAIPAEANVFELLLQKKQYHAQRRHYQPHNRHNQHNRSHFNRRVNRRVNPYGDRHNHRSNRRNRRRSFSRRAFHNQRNYGNHNNWHGRY